MLTSLALIGKVIEFLLTRIAGKKVDLSLDEKKRAAKAFVRLHEAILSLELILDNFLIYIEGFRVGRNSKIYEVHIKQRVLRNLEPASREFVDSLKQLTPVLSIYDPVLHHLLGEIYVLKLHLLTNFYYIVRQSLEDPKNYESSLTKPIFFNISESDKRFCSLEFSMPTDELLEMDLAYLQQKLNEKLLVEDQYLELLQIVRQNMETVQITYVQVDKLVALLPKLKEHRDNLDSARESLRKFIQDNFSLSDVLYVTK